MKNVRFIVVVTLLLLPAVTLVLGSGSSQAKSASSSFQMVSEVVCGTGGGAQSSSFTLKASAGGQGSPVGPQSSENYSGGGGWVYTTEEEGTRGDVNGDGIINIGDVVYLVTYLYKAGSAPDPLWTGDANSDGIINVGDVVYLISYLYRGGPPPCSPGGGREILALVSRLNSGTGHAQVSLELESDPAEDNSSAFAKTAPGDFDDAVEISVSAKFDRIVAGVELEIEFDPNQVTILDPVLSPLTNGLQLFAGVKGGTQKIGMVDLSGKNFLAPGEGALVTLRAQGSDLGSIKITKATLVDLDAKPLAIDLSGELNLEAAKDSDSRPQRFSLSQNYPNPFNPRTSIRYALPQDAHVRLTIYNVLGQKVATLVDEHQSAGYQVICWDGKDAKRDEVSSGVYFYRLEAGKFSEVKKMMLVK
ncbi:MAG: T9SS type A sorting domain-containing protein [Candidatus Zixiibacteriota bacterium]|nr:MAG: T9SS type A sorting domain-containing protein [candidate division Zixibacteria bacterium]